MTRQAQKQFENSLTKNTKENPKAIWQYIKSQSKLKEGITELNTDSCNEKSRLTSDMQTLQIKEEIVLKKLQNLKIKKSLGTRRFTSSLSKGDSTTVKAPVPPPRSRPDMSPVPPDLMPWKIGGNRGVSGSIKDLQSHQDVLTVESRYHPDLPRSHYDKSRCHYDTGTASLR